MRASIVNVYRIMAGVEPETGLFEVVGHSPLLVPEGYKLLFAHREMAADLLLGFVREPWVSEVELAHPAGRPRPVPDSCPCSDSSLTEPPAARCNRRDQR